MNHVISINHHARIAKYFSRWAGICILSFTAILLFLPIIALFITSIKLDSEYNAWPIILFPKVPQWINYQRVITLPRFYNAAIRTGLLGIVVAILTTISSAMAGYAFARFRVPINSKLFGIVIALLIVPTLIFLIPQFIMYARIKLTNTYWPWILSAIGGNAFYIFIFRQFFLNFPKELEEAAEVDGAGPVRIFVQVFLPNAAPVLASVMFFAFYGVWSDYLGPLIYLNEARTLLGVVMASAFNNPQGVRMITVTMAGTVLYILPPVIAFFLAQKHILKGVITSGLKG